MVPDDAKQDILPRVGWEKFQLTVAKVQTCPGTMAVREKLIAAYAKPLWEWAAPLVAPVSRQLPTNMGLSDLRRCWETDTFILGGTGETAFKEICPWCAV